MWLGAGLIMKERVIDMWTKRICASLVAASMMVIPAERAQAGSDAAKVLGGVILGLGAREIIRNHNRPRPSYVNTAQRQQTRDVQSALNYFGYHVGVVDGVPGGRTRAGIAQYQAQMGFNPDGRLEAYERQFLLTSHQRAMNSAYMPPYNQIMATQGPSGLLRSFRNEELGLVTPPPAHGGVPNPYQPDTRHAQPVPVPAPMPMPLPAPVPPTRQETNTLPQFPIVPAARSISEHCNEINVLTAANGGMSTAGRLGDANFALNEQFCLARTHAVSTSSHIAAGINGLTDSAVDAQCRGVAGALKEAVDTLATATPEMAMTRAAAVLSDSGLPMAQAKVTGEICLGAGYRVDNAEMALASALLLSAAGEAGYGEMISHHLREGFAARDADADVVQGWMAHAIAGAEQSAQPVLGQSSDRLAVLKAAGATSSETPVASLPVFGIQN